MSVNFTISKNFTKDLEGGYWNDPSAGHTYAGITFRYYPKWSGWFRLFQLAKKKYGSVERMPRYAKFNDAELDKHIADFYYNRHWKQLLNADLFRNQDIVNIMYDFVVHKEYDAIAVVNHVARQFNKNVSTSKTRVTPAVITLANNFQERFYAMLRYYRAQYYRNPRSIPGTSVKGFSAGLANAFIRDRVNKFPAATKPTIQFPIFNLPYGI